MQIASHALSPDGLASDSASVSLAETAKAMDDLEQPFMSAVQGSSDQSAIPRSAKLPAGFTIRAAQVSSGI